MRVGEFSGTLRPWAQGDRYWLVWTIPAGRCRAAPPPRVPEELIVLWGPTRRIELWGPTIPNYELGIGDPVVNLDPDAERTARRLYADASRRNGNDQVSLCVRGTFRSLGVGQWERRPAFELKVKVRGAKAVRHATSSRCTPP